MGMYTQIRGWLNIDSIGNNNTYYEVKLKLDKLIEQYEEVDGITTRKCQATYGTNICQGGNGSLFIFIGTEFKNYSNDSEEWIKYLIKHFPSAEGRIDFQYEECSEDYPTEYWEIYQGEILNIGKQIPYCNGYGNYYKEELKCQNTTNDNTNSEKD